jgi:hypothetical protein
MELSILLNTFKLYQTHYFLNARVEIEYNKHINTMDRLRAIYFSSAIKSTYICNECNQLIDSVVDGILWAHFIQKHCGMVTTTNGLREYMILWPYSSYVIYLDLMHLYVAYPQIAFLVWETHPNDILIRMLEIDLTWSSRIPSGVIAHIITEDAYPALDTILRTQTYKCMKCDYEYDCLPTIDMIAKHYHVASQLASH